MLLKHDAVKRLMSNPNIKLMTRNRKQAWMFTVTVYNTIYKQRHIEICALCLLLTGVLCTPMSQLLAASKTLAPHRAVYDMTLERAASSSGVTQLKGRMVYEITGNPCQGYTQRTRFVTHSIDRSGKVTIMDSRSKYWEDAIGKTFRFNIDHYQNEKVKEQSTGTAKRNNATDNVRVRISKPRRKNLDFSKNVLFPIQHSINLLAAARRGDTVFGADIYDGSEEGRQVYATTAIIGTSKTGAFNKALKRIQNAATLDGLTAWPVSLSFFEPQSKRADALPSYQLDFLFYENGVSRNLLLDYGYLSLRGELIALELFAPTKCKN